MTEFVPASRRHRRSRLTMLATLACLCAALSPAVAHAGPHSPTTAAVTLGDSFISGEAGRWQGNSIDATGCRRGTDRACTLDATTGLIPTYDTSSVYLGASDADGCHRSDVSELLTAGIAVDEPISLACSGAVTENIFRASSGGTVYKTEAPQADQLATVAAQKSVKVVVLSIGGNDLGFSSIILGCVEAYSARQGPCKDAQQAKVSAAMATAMAGVGKAVDEVRAVMTAAGYSQNQWRFVLQSYPSPVPRAAENRYPEGDDTRIALGSCPFYNADSDWARDSLVPQISDNLKGVAAAKGVQFLDLRDAFQGREICSTASSQVLTFPSPTTSEWARVLDLGVQGVSAESLHPNRYGQRAFGDCLGQIVTQRATRSYACRNTPGLGPDAMVLSRIS